MLMCLLSVKASTREYLQRFTTAAAAVEGTSLPHAVYFDEENFIAYSHVVEVTIVT